MSDHVTWWDVAMVCFVAYGVGFTNGFAFGAKYVTNLWTRKP